jgi:hypothetical protein
MKFQATVTFEFQASSLVDAGHKLNDAVEHAREADDMEAKGIELRTPPTGPPVTLPLTTGGVPASAPKAGDPRSGTRHWPSALRAPIATGKRDTHPLDERA